MERYSSTICFFFFFVPCRINREIGMNMLWKERDGEVVGSQIRKENVEWPALQALVTRTCAGKVKAIKKHLFFLGRKLGKSISSPTTIAIIIRIGHGHKRYKIDIVGSIIQYHQQKKN
jgi:hypothetical protein